MHSVFPCGATQLFTCFSTGTQNCPSGGAAAGIYTVTALGQGGRARVMRKSGSGAEPTTAHSKHSAQPLYVSVFDFLRKTSPHR